MKKMKKILALVLCLVLAVGAVTGTLAYLTDRDSEVNVFTVGDVSIELNEEFEQGSKLTPGVDIKKEATITNTGKNDAWVWLTVLLPEEMGPYTAPDNMSASNNVVHWNYPAESVANITVDFNSTPVNIDTDGDGATESYYQTNMLWKNILEAGETTGVMLSKVYMDTRVDIDPDGNMYWVVNGVATDLNWNVKENGNPVIHVSAYAIQNDGFDTVQEAYNAYSKQWGTNGTEYGEVASVATAEELSKALTADEENINVILENDIDVPISSLGTQTPGSGEYKLGGENTENITILLNGNKLNITTTYWSAIGAKNADATITIKGGSMTSSQATGTWNSYDVTFANCNYVINDVIFDKAIAFTNAGKSVKMSNVTINETHDYYAMWITAEGQNVEIDGLTVNSAGRGIKIDEQYVVEDEVAKVTLKVSDSTFKTAKKAAIMVKSAKGADVDLDNVDITQVTADTTNAVWVDAESANYFDLVNVTGGSKNQET